MQNSDILGQRYLTNKTKNRTREAQEREEFLDELRKLRENSQSNPAGENHE